MEKKNTTLPAAVRDAVLVKSVPHDALGPEIRGYDFNKGINLNALLESYLYTGFQATNFGLAVEEINKMVCTHSPFFRASYRYILVGMETES
jgi:deoxyhypusine synthase